jgi:glutamate racemase
MPLGFFDSGFGGLTVYRKAREILPQYDMLYLGDTARTPYGSRSFEAILRFTTEGVEYLFAQGCDLVIIACNTASAKALRTIQQKILPVKYPGKRVLGIIRPSAEALARQVHHETGVALWATDGTVRSDSYALELAKLAPDLRLVQIACPMLVPLVESGELSGPGLQYFLEKYWRMTAEAAGPLKIDTLLLACTHYPLLYPALRALVPAETRILVQAEIIAPALADYLVRHPEIESRLTRGGSERFLTTDQTENFARLASLFLGRSVSAERVELSETSSGTA